MIPFRVDSLSGTFYVHAPSAVSALMWIEGRIKWTYGLSSDPVITRLERITGPEPEGVKWED